jgi:hypothetical protein
MPGRWASFRLVALAAVVAAGTPAAPVLISGGGGSGTFSPAPAVSGVSPADGRRREAPR